MSVTPDIRSDSLAADRLVPVLSARWAWSWRSVPVVLFFGSVFLAFNYLPISHAETWNQVVQGQWVLEHGRLPTEPVGQPLGEGMDLMHTTWGSQLLFALLERWGGPQQLSNLYAGCVLAYALVLARVFYRQTRRGWLAIGGVGAVFVLGWDVLSHPSPALLGGLCLALALAILSEAGGDRGCIRFWGWPATGLLMLVWANLHSSYALGLLLLGCFALARMIEVCWQERNPLAVLYDRASRGWILLAELGLVASLVHPQGAQLPLATWNMLSNENLRDLTAWLPLRLSSPSGAAFVLSLAALTAIFRGSRRPVRVVEVLLLLAYGLLVLPSGRMLGWYAPVFVYVVMPHLADGVERIFPRRESESASDKAPLQPKDFAFTLVCALVAWCCFALAPISQGLLGGQRRATEQVVGPQLPLGASDSLAQQQPAGLVFAPIDWAAWLVYQEAAPQGVFLMPSVEQVPGRVWSDYKRIMRAEAGWDRALDRYAVNTLVLQKDHPGSLSEEVGKSLKWQIVFENENAVVARRRNQEVVPADAEGVFSREDSTKQVRRVAS